MTWDEELDRYLAHQEARGRSAEYRNTLRCYLRGLGRATNPASFQDLTEDDLVGWFAGLRKKGLKGGKGLSESSLAAVAGHVRMILRWLNDGESPPSVRNLTIGRRQVPRVRSKDELLTDTEADRMAKAMGPRDRTIFLLLRRTGARPSEVLGLRAQDIQWENGRSVAELVFRETKTDVPRTVPVVNPTALQALKDHLEVSQPEEKDLLFPSPRKDRAGEPLTYRGFWRAMRRAARKVGLEKRAYPYLLRHGRATELMDAPRPVATRLMGWRGGGVMWANYTHLATDDLRDYLMKTEGPPSSAMSEDEAKEILGRLLVRVSEDPALARELRKVLSA